MRTLEQFKETIKNHKVEILNDNGVNRTLLCQAPDTRNRYFYITTWPGHLCISGDMGCYTFSRLDDMFEFFGRDLNEDINLGYWHEKLKSESTYRGCFEWCREQAQKEILEHMVDYYSPEVADIVEDYNYYNIEQALIDKGLGEQWNNNLEYLAEAYIADDEHEYIEAMGKVDRDTAEGLWDAGSKPTDQYVWCMRAIVWAIGEYHKQKI